MMHQHGTISAQYHTMNEGEQVPSIRVTISPCMRRGESSTIINLRIKARRSKEYTKVRNEASRQRGNIFPHKISTKTCTKNEINIFPHKISTKTCTKNEIRG